MTVAEIQTQGRADYDRWTKSFKLQITLNGSTWTDVEGGKEFPANSVRNTVVSNKLSPPLRCRGLRILPWTWSGWICLRSEVYVVS